MKQMEEIPLQEALKTLDPEKQVLEQVLRKGFRRTTLLKHTENFFQEALKTSDHDNRF